MPAWGTFCSDVDEVGVRPVRTILSMAASPSVSLDSRLRTEVETGAAESSHHHCAENLSTKFRGQHPAPYSRVSSSGICPF